MTSTRSEPPFEHVLVACARNEQDYVQEWIEYHRSVGFDHIFLYCNDDHPHTLMSKVAPWLGGPQPFVTFIYWPFDQDRPGAPKDAYPRQQAAMYLDFLRRHRHRARWFSFLDLDEFFVFPGAGTVSRFLGEHAGTADCIYFNWLPFGNSARLVRDDGSVLLSYLHRSSTVDHHTKYLCKAAKADPERIVAGMAKGRAAFWHGLDPYEIPAFDCRNVLGQPMDGYWARFPQSAIAMLGTRAATPDILLAGYVAHYGFKSEDDFVARSRRADGNAKVWGDLAQSGKHRDFLVPFNAVYDAAVARDWFDKAWRGRASRVASGRADPPNVALDKPASQSTVGPAPPELSATSRMVGWGNNGVATGGFGFCTQRQPSPFWIVDLLEPHRIERVVVFNRLDDPAAACEAARLQIWVSSDRSAWHLVFQRAEEDAFGGIDGAPLVVRFEDLTARFVRLQLPETGTLHLDEVEVYGRPIAVANGDAPLPRRSLTAKLKALLGRASGR